MRRLFILLLFPFSITAQTLKEDKVDEFTKKSVKRTSWETVCGKGSFYTYAQSSKINDNRFLTFRIMSNAKVYVVNEGDELMLKLANDSIVSLKVLKRAISCRGCGSIGIIGSAADGIEVVFDLKEEIYTYLLLNKVAKMRLQTSSGYIEAELKDKHAEMLIRVLELIK